MNSPLRLSARSPLFVAAGLTGTVPFLQEMKAYLNPDRPIYGLERVKCGQFYERDMTRIGEAYAQEIIREQPQGPYHLIGYSYGGQCAYETAIALEAAGKEVAFLGILDDHADVYRRRFNILNQHRDYTNAIATGRISCDSIQLHQFSGKLTLFRAQQWQAAHPPGPGMDWEKLARGGVDVFDVPGGHRDVPSPKSIGVWAPFLNQTLEQLDGNHVVPNPSCKPNFVPSVAESIPSAAFTAFRMAQKGDLSGEIANYRDALLQNPNAPDWVRCNLAKALLQSGEVDQAIKVLEPHLEDHRPVQPQHMVLMKCYLNKQEPRNTQAFAEYCFGLPNETACDLQFLALILIESGRLKMAEVALKAALKKDPSRFDCRRRAIALLRDQGRAREAEIVLKDGLKLYPNIALAHVLMGEVKLDLGQPDQAATHFQKALSLDPKFKRATVGLCRSLSEVNRIPEAFAIAQDALAKDPNWYRMHVILGQLSVKSKQFPQAEFHFRQATKRVSEEVAGWFGLARLFLRQGLFDKMTELQETVPAEIQDRPEFKELMRKADLAIH